MSENTRLKAKDIDSLRRKISLEQNNKCWICEIDLSSVKACLDHDHFTGRIRSVLCQNCNGIEGKIKNLSNRGKRDKTRYDFVNKILSYWNFHSAHQREEIHPSHRTEDEKRLIRNKKARLRRKKKKVVD
jgi:hypothetical protein